MTDFIPIGETCPVRDATIAKTYAKGNFTMDVIMVIPFYELFYGSVKNPELFFLIKCYRMFGRVENLNVTHAIAALH